MRRLLVGLIFLLWLVAQPALAAVIEPTSAALQLSVGAQDNQVWTITNNSGEAARYSVELQQATFGQLADDVHFSSLSADQRSWFRLSPENFVLQPEGTQDVQLSVDVPTDAADQSFAIAVFVLEETEATGGGIGLQQGTAALTFITVGDDQKPEVTISDFQVFHEQKPGAPVHFVAALTNSGSGLAQPQIQVVVRDLFGRVVTTLNMNETGRRLPAKTTRAYSVDWPLPTFAFGPYRADIVVLPSDGAELLGKEASMVLFTWQSIALAALILVALGLLGWRAKRFLKR